MIGGASLGSITLAARRRAHVTATEAPAFYVTPGFPLNTRRKWETDEEKQLRRIRSGIIQPESVSAVNEIPAPVMAKPAPKVRKLAPELSLQEHVTALANDAANYSMKLKAQAERARQKAEEDDIVFVVNTLARMFND